MSKLPKIVCIGAGSAVFGLGNLASIMRSRRLRGSEVVLVDTDRAGLKTMTALAHRMNEAWGAEMTVWSTTEREEALPGANSVVVSVQVGPREEVWELDLAVSSVTVDAAVRGDRQLALQALLLDPMVNDINRARAHLGRLFG